MSEGPIARKDEPNWPVDQAHMATKMEFDAALTMFAAACVRNDAKVLNIATEAVHTALQNHLDAIANVHDFFRRLPRS